MFSLFVAFCALIGLQYIHRDKLVSLIFFCTLVILLNVKFTGVVYAFVAIVSGLIILWLENHIHQCKRIVSLSIVGVLFGLCFVGFNPYMTNLWGFGSPFYPLAGEKAIDLKPYNVPQNYFDKNSLEILFLSIFSKSDNVRGENTFAHIKVPFTFERSEIQHFSETKSKEGGFGPLFSGAIVLSLAILFLSMIESKYRFRLVKNSWKVRIEQKSIKEQHKNFETYRIVLFLAVALILSAVLNPISSLARYVPQVWLLPVVIVFLAFLSKWRVIHVFGFAVVLTLFINNTLVAREYFQTNYRNSQKIWLSLNNLRLQSQHKPLEVYFGEFRMSTQLKLNKNGIQYVTVDQLELCQNKRRFLLGNVAYLCN